jgi:hypothetical protein
MTTSRLDRWTRIMNWAAALSLFGLLLMIFFFSPTERTMGQRLSHPLLACRRCLGRSRYAVGRPHRRHPLPAHSRAALGRRLDGVDRDWTRLCDHDDRQRLRVGAPGVEYLVDLGDTPDLDHRDVARLRRLLHAARRRGG